MTRSVLTLCLVCLLLLPSLTPVQAADAPAGSATPAATGSPLEMQRFIDERTFYLDNGTLRLGVCPALGRIVWVGSTRSPDNLLWRNEARGVLEDQAAHGWSNWGGDKVWPAPQSDWPKVMGRRWPPDPVIDGLPWRVLERHELGCTLESPPSPYWGVTVRRQITLDPQRPRVEIRNTLTCVAERALPVNAWSVTQVRHPAYCLLGVGPDKMTEQPWRWLNAAVEQTPPAIGVADGAVRCAPPFEPATKIGTMGRWIAAVYPGCIFLQHAAEPDPSLTYADNSAVHTYADARCVELELLGPIHSLDEGEHLVHVVTWQLIERPAADHSVQQDLRAILARLAEER